MEIYEYQKLVKNLGYIGQCFQVIDIDMETVIQENIAKLAAGFEKEFLLNRKD
ncbi:MAG: hypothetical protein ACI4WG_07305 [Erysipelotrichaceae bacterium]